MIKLQDFAREQGVTDRAVQKHLKKYASELEGLFERNGPNGTWLSEEACNILRTKMRQQPLAIFNEDPRLAKLEAELEETKKRLDDKEKLLAMAQKQAQELLEEAGKVKALEEGRKALEGKIEALESERDEIDRKAREARDEAQKTLESLSSVLEDERKQHEDEKHLLEQQILAMKKAPFWRRLVGWKE